MDKGVITELEYYRAVRDAMKRDGSSAERMSAYTANHQMSLPKWIKSAA